MTIQIPDLINGIFEAGGGFMLMLDVYTMIRDKKLSGVHWLPKLWFMSWGWFNVYYYYYPHLHQTLSFLGGLLIVTVNTIWLIAYMKYVGINAIKTTYHEWRTNHTLQNL